MEKELQGTAARPRFRHGRGLVLGKFLPPHRGHQFLIEFARQYVEHLTVLVCSLEREPIPGTLRYQWIRQMFPQADVSVTHETRDLPQEPADHPDFWSIWQRVMKEAAPNGIDFFFASEGYGHDVARVMDAQYVEVDRSRQLMPVSGTAVRENPMKHWEMLPEVVRPYFLKRVCIFGPESTGKSTLAQLLAKEFTTVHAWEYARPLLDPQNGTCTVDDIPRIVRGQIATEEALALHANRVLFCDTDVLTTTIWSDVLFGHTPDWITELAEQRSYDLYLVMDVDVPWIADGQRFFSEQKVRQQMFDRFLAAIQSRHRPFKIIRGNWEQRFESACHAVRELIGD